MEQTLQSQINFAQDLLTSLNSLMNVYAGGVQQTSNQSSNLVRVVSGIVNIRRQMEETLDNSNSFVQAIDQTLSQDAANRIQTTSQNISRGMRESVSQVQQSVQRSNNIVESSTRELDRVTSENARTDERLTRGLNNTNNTLQTTNTQLENSLDDIDDFNESMNRISNAADSMGIAKDAVLTGGTSLLIDVPKLLMSVLGFGFNVVSSLISSAFKFYTFTLTLPFTVANLVMPLANAIRSDLIEVIQGAGEEAKEAFDLSSRIGKSADILTQKAKGMLKTFENPKSRLAMLFGQGASGAAAFLKETFKAVESMGHYGEVFGESIMKSPKTAQFIIEMQRGMGIGAQEMAYYALDAYQSGKNPVEYLTSMSKMLKSAADENDLDFKAIAKEYHKLKSNIVDFGHMSSVEIKDLTVKLRKMKVKTDDAVNVFKKFTSLEEATKASAMLFQSFEMNIDAFDLLTARDPGEMLKQFRDAMFQTGRSFKDLNRHEKALMSNITGISDQSLSSLMNFMNQGLEYDEAKKRLEEQDPTKEQTKMIKGLKTTIKQVQKTLQFKSPFEAFFSGLFENVQGQNELQSALIDLNKLYESIYKLGNKLDLSHVEGMVRPLITVLTKVQNLVTGGDFVRLLTKMTSSASEFMSDIAYDLETSTAAKEFKLFGIRVQSATKNLLNAEYVAAESAALGAINIFLKENPNLDINVHDELKSIFSKNKKGIYTIAKGLTLDKAVSALEAAARNTRDNPTAQRQLLLARQKIEDAYMGQITNPEGKKILEEDIKKTTTVKGRIDKTYDNLFSLFEEGMPIFEGFHKLSGKIMGTIIKGFMGGLSGAIQIFTGGVDQAVVNLGLASEDALKDAFPGKDPSKVTLLDMLGMSKKDIGGLNEGLFKESRRFTSNLPKIGNFALTLVDDLKDMFYEFALGLGGVVADMTLKAYNETSDAGRLALQQAGFDPIGAARAMFKASKESKSFFKKVGLGSTSSLLQYVSYSDDKTGTHIKIGAQSIGGFLEYFSQLKNNLDPASEAYSFLSSTNIQNLLKYIENQDNFISKIEGVQVGTGDYEQRIQALLKILVHLKSIDSVIPSDFIVSMRKSIKDEEKFNKALNVMKLARREDFIKEQQNRDKDTVKFITIQNKEDFAKFLGTFQGDTSNMFFSLFNSIGLGDKTIEGNIRNLQDAQDTVSSDAYFSSKKNQDLLASILHLNKNNIDLSLDNVNAFKSVKDSQNEVNRIKQLGLLNNAQDFFLRESNMKIISSKGITYLDDLDTVIAFKKGGDFEKQLGDYVLKFKNMTNTKANSKESYEKSKFSESEYTEDKGKLNMKEVFDMINETISLVKNRKIVAKPAIIKNV